MKASLLCLFLAACGPLDSWNAPKTGYVDTVTGCHRAFHAVRGPDQYDIDHGRPYHCEAPAHDPDFYDIDQVDQ